MPLTREAKKRILKKVIDEILDTFPGGPVSKAFKQNDVYMIANLVSLNKQMIQSFDNINGKDDDAVVYVLNKGMQHHFIISIEWYSA